MKTTSELYYITGMNGATIHPRMFNDDYSAIEAAKDFLNEKNYYTLNSVMVWTEKEEESDDGYMVRSTKKALYKIERKEYDYDRERFETEVTNIEIKE